MIQSPANRCTQLLRQRLNSQIGAMLIQNAEHKEISADENMASHVFAQFTECIGNSNLLLHHRHMATLTTLGLTERTVEPFLIRHLFWKAANHFPVRSKRC